MPPLPAQHLYNATFSRLDVLDILNTDLSLNEERYAEVGPLRLSPYFALTYGVSFAVLSSALMTVLLWHVGDIRKAIAASRSQSGDAHIERGSVASVAAGLFADRGHPSQSSSAITRQSRACTTLSSLPPTSPPPSSCSCSTRCSCPSGGSSSRSPLPSRSSSRSA